MDDKAKEKLLRLLWRGCVELSQLPLLRITRGAAISLTFVMDEMEKLSAKGIGGQPERDLKLHQVLYVCARLIARKEEEDFDPIETIASERLTAESMEKGIDAKEVLQTPIEPGSFGETLETVSGSIKKLETRPSSIGSVIQELSGVLSSLERVKREVGFPVADAYVYVDVISLLRDPQKRKRYRKRGRGDCNQTVIDGGTGFATSFTGTVGVLLSPQLGSEAFARRRNVAAAEGTQQGGAALETAGSQAPALEGSLAPAHLSGETGQGSGGSTPIRDEHPDDGMPNPIAREHLHQALHFSPVSSAPSEKTVSVVIASGRADSLSPRGAPVRGGFERAESFSPRSAADKGDAELRGGFDRADSLSPCGSADKEDAELRGGAVDIDKSVEEEEDDLRAPLAKAAVSECKDTAIKISVADMLLDMTRRTAVVQVVPLDAETVRGLATGRTLEPEIYERDSTTPASEVEPPSTVDITDAADSLASEYERSNLQTERRLRRDHLSRNIKAKEAADKKEAARHKVVDGLEDERATLRAALLAAFEQNTRDKRGDTNGNLQMQLRRALADVERYRQSVVERQLQERDAQASHRRAEAAVAEIEQVQAELGDDAELRKMLHAEREALVEVEKTRQVALDELETAERLLTEGKGNLAVVEEQLRQVKTPDETAIKEMQTRLRDVEHKLKMGNLQWAIARRQVADAEEEVKRGKEDIRSVCSRIGVLPTPLELGEEAQQRRPTSPAPLNRPTSPAPLNRPTSPAPLNRPTSPAPLYRPTFEAAKKPLASEAGKKLLASEAARKQSASEAKRVQASPAVPQALKIPAASSPAAKRQLAAKRRCAAALSADPADQASPSADRPACAPNQRKTPGHGGRSSKRAAENVAAGAREGEQSAAAAGDEASDEHGSGKCLAINWDAFSVEPPHAIGYPFITDHDERLSSEALAQKRATPDERGKYCMDLMAGVNCRIMPKRHVELLALLCYNYLERVEIKEEQLATARMQEGEKTRYLRIDKVFIMREYVKYLAKAKELRCPFFFENFKSLKQFISTSRIKDRFPRIKDNTMGKMMLAVDAIIFFQSDSKSRIEYNSLSATGMEHPELLFNLIPKDRIETLGPAARALLQRVMVAGEVDMMPVEWMMDAAQRELTTYGSMFIELCTELRAAIDRHVEAARHGVPVGALGQATAAADAAERAESLRSAKRRKLTTTGAETASQLFTSDSEDNEESALQASSPAPKLHIRFEGSRQREEQEQPWIALPHFVIEPVRDTFARLRYDIPQCVAAMYDDKCQHKRPATRDDRDAMEVYVRHSGYPEGIAVGVSAREVMAKLEQQVKEMTHGRVTKVTATYCQVNQKALERGMEESGCPQDLLMEPLGVFGLYRDNSAAAVILERDGHSCGASYACILLVIRGVLSLDATRASLRSLSQLFYEVKESTPSWMLDADGNVCPCQGDGGDQPTMGLTGACRILGCVHKDAEEGGVACSQSDGDKNSFVEGATEQTRRAVLTTIHGLAETAERVLRDAAPVAFKNQTMLSVEAKDCRLGYTPSRSPFSTACVTFDATKHVHRSDHESPIGVTTRLCFVDASQDANDESKRGVAEQSLILPYMQASVRGGLHDKVGISVPVIDGSAVIGAFGLIDNLVTEMQTRVDGGVAVALVDFSLDNGLTKPNHGRTVREQVDRGGSLNTVD